MDQPAQPLDELDRALDEIARAPVLLVASDYDGTVAPIVADPANAEADREALVALRTLSQLPQTRVAIISGRALSDLASRTAEAGDIHLVGSHGSEFEAGFITPLSQDARRRLDELIVALEPIAQRFPGAMIERKPASLAFHYRNVAPQHQQAARDAVLQGPASLPAVYCRLGKMVVELSVIETNKGAALQRLRQRLGASAVIFIGDDATDEDAFATLTGPDISVKVGDGPTRARYRVRDTFEVARRLAHLAEQRCNWLAGAEAVPIEQHALLSDQRTVALLAPNGRIVWMCVPRIDSAAVFAALLGGPVAGYFEIRPTDPRAAARLAYVGDTFILRTDWPGLTVTDYLDVGRGRAFQRAGRTDLLRVVEGRGKVRVVFAPRLDFGRVATRLTASEQGVVVEGAIEPLVLVAPGLAWRIVDEGTHQTALATFELDGRPRVFELRSGTASLTPSPTPEPARRALTERFWSGWCSALQIPPGASGLVRRSALVLKALTYGPSGAIVAAATTSLPEHAGGVRNWDYRYCWPRDAALAARALARLGNTGPAIKLLDWVLGILEDCEPGALISPVYTVTGGHLGSEGEIPQLAGYRGSRPVRVGNAAAHQVQLDVFGPIADLAATLAQRDAPLSTEHWRLIESMVAAVARRWREPDHGIWEVRLARRHHVHSKIMCWQTVDRALRVARYLGRRQPDWEALREQIASDVLAHGWNPRRRAYCATYDGDEPDAAALWIGLSVLLEPTDERFASTIALVERELRAGPTVYRYRFDDGLPGLEGGFHLCTCWLIEALALVGRHSEAAELLGDYTRLAGPLGLLAEEYDPRTGLALGNFPQAYSHLGLIEAALRVAQQA